MYFFTEHSELEPQTSAEAYGALSSIEYRISSLFKATIPTKAFACQEGQIIVQQSQLSADLVNVVLQPTDELQHHIKPQFYIYRGIRKDSLFNGTNIIQPGNGSSEFIDRYFSQNPTEFGAELLGYNNSFADSLRIEELFAFPEPNSYTTKVIAGEWFGMFGNEFAQDDYRVEFETILDSRLLKFNLEYLRLSHYIVDASDQNMSDLELRTKREEILAFIDLAAFFGSFYDNETGVKLISYSNNTKSEEAFKKQAIYNSVLFGSGSNSKFITSNMVYLDIRSEKGFSYNFYGNYGDSVTGNNFDLSFGSTAQVNTYASNGWPIISINSNQGNESVNKITFRLRIDDNRLPIIYLADPKVLNPERNNSNRFLTKADIFDNVTNPSVDWSRPITFKFRNSSASSSNKPNIANYIRIYYFRQECDYDEHDAALDYNHYYNGAFCPIDFDGKTFRSAHPVYVREAMKADGTGNFGFTADTGAYRDDSRTIFYSNYNGNGKPVFSGKKYLPTYEKNLELSNADFQSSLHPRIHTIVRDYPINASTSRRIAGINAFFDGDVLKEKEDALMLGLTNAEIDAIRAAPGLSDIHERYIYLMPAAGNPLIDTDNKRYRSFTLQLQGLNNAGARTIITPQINSNNVTLYSRDNVFFSSDAFGHLEEVSQGENRIEYHIHELPNEWERPDDLDIQSLPLYGTAPTEHRQYRDGRFLINDNIDLALIYENQRLFYVFYSLDGLDYEVCNFEIVMCNKMTNGSSQLFLQNPYPGYVDEKIYTGAGNAEHSYYYNDGSVLTDGNLNYYRLYNSDGKKAFLVHFEELQFPDLNIDMGYVETERYYVGQSEAASFIGALAKVGFRVESTGFAFLDGTCYPSQTHVNGKAVDKRYQVHPGLGGSWVDEQQFVDAMFRYGYEVLWRGPDSDPSAILELASNGGSLHDDHLHSGKLWIALI